MGLPGESRRIAAHSTSAGTSPTAHTTAENPMSKARLIARYPAPPRRGAATVGSGAGGTNTPSIAWCPPLTPLSTPPDSASWSSDANSSASTMTAVSDPKIACDLDSSTAPSLANGVSSTSILNTPPFTTAKKISLPNQRFRTISSPIRTLLLLPNMRISK